MPPDDGGDRARFVDRVARIALQRGVHLKPISLNHVARRVRGERSDEMSDAEIFEALKRTAAETPVHFGLPDAKPTQNSRERALNDLERVNQHAEFVRRSNPEQKVKLSDSEKARLKRWGAGAMLNEANIKAGTLPPFENESNADE